MRNVSPTDAILSADKAHCRECGYEKGSPHAAGCVVGSYPELAHRYQKRAFGGPAGRPWETLPSELEAFRALPWWRRIGGAERHFRRPAATRADST
jgi:hypothetical protein